MGPDGATGLRCGACGTDMEADMAFCPTCGRPKGTPPPTSYPHAGPWPGGAGPPPGVGAPMPGMPPPGIAPVGMPPVYPMMPYHRPPRNPHQTASSAGGAIMLVAGIFAFLFGTLIIRFDAFDTTWPEEDLVLNPIPFVVGLLHVLAFATSAVGTYCCLRLIRFEVTLVGPVLLIVAYVSLVFYEPFVMFLAVEIIVMAPISLALVLFGRRAFVEVAAGRGAGTARPMPQGPGGPEDMGGAPPPPVMGRMDK